MALDLPLPPKLLTSAEENALFWRVRRWAVAALLREVFEQARLRAVVLLAVSVGFWAGLFLLFFEAFTLLETALVHPGTRAQTVQTVFNVFFLALTGMLMLSSAIILYGSLYRSEQTEFLLTTPATCRRIVLHKLEETVVFSCWGFFMLGTPLLIAYGVVAHSPWYYFLLLPFFMATFVLIPTGLGAILCLVVVRVMPAMRVYVLAVAGVALLLSGGWFWWNTLGRQTSDMLTPQWFQTILARLEIAQYRLLPNWWLSSGLLEAAHPAAASEGLPAWAESLLFLAVLTSNALIVHWLAGWTGELLLRSSYSGLSGIARPQKNARGNWLDAAVRGLCRPLPPVMRSLVVKDLRLFRRDPLQWSQVLIFFGLLALYLVNIRRFQYGEPLAQWMTVVGFLNLAVVGLILSTFTTRFIFPMISLEGRRLWVLGTLPIDRDTILWSKFLFAMGGCWPACAALILLSDVMLGIAARSPLVVAVHQLVCAVLCVGLCALAVGLGARLPNLRESSPSKIAAGYGGTLNLVLSAILIIVVVLATAIPTYFWLEAGHGKWLQESGYSWGLGTLTAVLAGCAIAFACGIAATVIPLRAGMRYFRQLEL